MLSYRRAPMWHVLHRLSINWGGATSTHRTRPFLSRYTVVQWVSMITLSTFNLRLVIRTFLQLCNEGLYCFPEKNPRQLQIFWKLNLFKIKRNFITLINCSSAFIISIEHTSQANILTWIWRFHKSIPEFFGKTFQVVRKLLSILFDFLFDFNLGAFSFKAFIFLPL